MVTDVVPVALYHSRPSQQLIVWILNKLFQGRVGRIYLKLEPIKIFLDRRDAQLVPPRGTLHAPNRNCLRESSGE